jgi:hypothetical protein
MDNEEAQAVRAEGLDPGGPNPFIKAFVLLETFQGE